MTPSSVGEICLVEDDEIMGESLVDRFELEGFRCDWHRSALTAASDLKEKRYDVVVSDIRLPDRDGDELFERLRLAAESVGAAGGAEKSQILEPANE